jgi:UPF0176 protein
LGEKANLLYTASVYTVILFYKFVPIADPAALREEMRALAAAHGLKGRMLLAREGVNATFEGTSESIESYKAALRENPLFADVVFKESASAGNSFSKLQIKVRDEVVTLEAGEFDVAKDTAPAISAEELERMYEEDEDFVVLDLRNDYETAVGKFEKTFDPGLTLFRDLPGKVESFAHLKNKKVVAVCTGGIRCEKATCLLKKEGFENVVQLKDGIHTYMQKFPGSRFKGSLFVFDNRMVTPVVEEVDYTVMGKCEFCGDSAETFYNDDRVRPSIKVICCSECASSHPELRPSVSIERQSASGDALNITIDSIS